MSPYWLISIRELKKQPYSNPNFARDEIVVYVRPNSYLLPVTVTDVADYDAVEVGTVPFKKSQNNPWMINGLNVYTMPFSIAAKMSKQIRSEVGNDNPFVEWFHNNRYVSQRLYYIELPKPSTEETLHVIGFLAQEKDLVFTNTVEDTDFDPSVIKTSEAREIDPNFFVK